MNEIEKVFTLETRLRPSPELRQYLSQLATYYNFVYRFMWKEYNSPKFHVNYKNESRFKTAMSTRFTLHRRCVNTILMDIKGRRKALLELKKAEAKQLAYKIASLEKEKKELRKQIERDKPLAGLNKLNFQQKQKYKQNKYRMHYLNKRLNNKKQKLAALKMNIKNKKVAMVFGGKKLFNAQYNLEANGFKSHADWKRAYIKKRDANILYIGSKDESFGNLIAQLRPAGNQTYQLVLSKEMVYRTPGSTKRQDQVLCLEGIEFKHMGDELDAIIQAHATKRTNQTAVLKPITVRFRHVGRRWYMQVMIPLTYQSTTRYSNGVIGIDYNESFMECVETDGKGNMVNAWREELRFQGKGRKGESEIRQLSCKTARYAAAQGKDMTIEDLDFAKTKGKMIPARSKKGKKYNKMLSQFAYSRFATAMENACFKQGVGVVKVDPRDTSKIGKQKYCRAKKLNGHRAAAYVIARRGQGFTDQSA